jgi:hypothetical protein
MFQRIIVLLFWTKSKNLKLPWAWSWFKPYFKLEIEQNQFNWYHVQTNHNRETLIQTGNWTKSIKLISHSNKSYKLNKIEKLRMRVNEWEAGELNRDNKIEILPCGGGKEAAKGERRSEARELRHYSYVEWTFFLNYVVV